jgi:large subunit ribosomal protein L2
MKFKKISPKTNGVRHAIKICKNLLVKKHTLCKNLNIGLNKQSGRCSITGRITVRHIGGGCKTSLQIINFKKKFYNSIVIGIIYDAIRSSFLSLNFDFNTKTFFKTLATEFVYPGSFVVFNASKNELNLGDQKKIFDIPPGSIVSNILLNSNNKKSTYVKAAGTSCQILQKILNSCYIRLPSGKITYLSQNSIVTLGKISNQLHSQIVLGKAGINRLLNKRPTVRGIAMNPVDHPHGGRTNGGMPSVTPWGIPTKGKPTVKKN